MKVPVFDISCIQKFSNQANKSFVSDTFFQNTYQYLMIDIVEKSLNITFYEPFHARKCLLNIRQGSVAAS